MNSRDHRAKKEEERARRVEAEVQRAAVKAKLEEMKEQGRAPEASPVSVTAPEIEM